MKQGWVLGRIGRVELVVSQGGFSVCIGDARFGRASATLGGGEKRSIDKETFDEKGVRG